MRSKYQGDSRVDARKNGIQIEWQIEEALRSFKCRVRRARGHENHEEKTDLFIEIADTKKFDPPIRVQLTMRCGDIKKIETFKDVHRARSRCLCLYVEIQNATAGAVAFEIFKFIQRHPAATGMWSLQVITEGRSYAQTL